MAIGGTPRKRFGRTLISEGAARQFAFDQYLTGSDHADYAGDCAAPVMVAMTGCRDKRLAWLQMLKHETDWPGTDYAPGHGWLGDVPSRPLETFGAVQNVDVAVRCRRCAPCLAARASMWRLRAIRECERASRTWFVTLTLDPRWQFHLRTKARAAIAEQGLDWDSLEPGDRFRVLCKPLRVEFQRFMKRLRKSAGGLRFFLVVERHKSGDPHLHMLLHEREQPCRWRAIDAAWRWGFHKSNLVDDAVAAARYAAKYVTKSADCRIVASIRYGADAEPTGGPVGPASSSRRRSF